MILLGFRRKLTAQALCKSIESAIQWFQIHHTITFATIRNSAVYLSGARVSIFSTLVPQLEPVHEISNNVVCATKASDQPAHTRSLVRAFASRLSIL